MKEKQKTIGQKVKTRNGIKRVSFCAICILLEVAFLVVMMTKLNEYYGIVSIAMGLLGLAIVLGLCASDKATSLKMPWIFLILLFPILGVSLYLLIGLNGGTRKMKARYADVDNKLFPLLPDNSEKIAELKEKNPNAGAISEYIKRNAFYPLYQNTDVKYFDDAMTGYKAMINEISKAEKYVFMEYFAIQNSEAWKMLEEVLVDRVKAGVEVRVFYDDFGSVGFVNIDFAKMLSDEGIDCKVFNPATPGLNVFLNNRDHRKMTIIDGKVAFTGGFNIADEYFNITRPYKSWKDTGVRLEGDAVQSLAMTFLENWNAVSDKDVDDTDFTKYIIKYDYTATNEGYVQPYADSPMDNEQVGEEVYISMLNKAEKYCWFMTPYLIITDEMVHAMRLASKRGVDVRIITPGVPDKKIIYSVTRSFYHCLVEYGVRVYEWTPGFSHAKMCVADDRMALCGTINLDYRSLYHHFENACFFAECDTVTDIRDDFVRTMEESTEVTELYKAKEKAYMRAGQLIMRLFSGLL